MIDVFFRFKRFPLGS